MMQQASRRRALRPTGIGRGGAVVRAATVILFTTMVGLDGAMGSAGADPDRPVSSEDEAITAAPAVNEGVTGVIVEENGVPVPDVFVQVIPADAAAGPVPEIAITSDERGRYQWPLPPGRYVVSIAPPGFAPEIKEVVVVPGRLGALDFVVNRAQP